MTIQEIIKGFSRNWSLLYSLPYD